MPAIAQRFAEPWRTTAFRTGTLAIAVGGVAGLMERRIAVVPPVILFALWFTLGGHFVELLFRNRLRGYIGDRPATVAFARIACWFVGGSVLFAGALATLLVLPDRMPVHLSWWLAGVGFVGVELLVHLGLRARGQPNFYDGRG